MHPKIACGWEWAQRGYWKNKTKIAERALNGDFSDLMENERNHIAELIKKNPQWMGYRRLFRATNQWVFYPGLSPALWVDQLSMHLKWLAGQKDMHVIHIVRCDNFSWIKSKYLSSITNSYVGKAYPENARITIPVNESNRRIRSKNWVDQRLATLSETNPYLRIYYEDFLCDQKAAIESALKFLECNLMETGEDNRKIKRQSSEKSREQIVNYDELKKYLTKNNQLFAAFDAGSEARCKILCAALN